jgi:polar amino acid transport system substrate-binding protein
MSKIKIAITDFPPLIFAKGEEYKGFEIDLWNAIAKELGMDFEYEKHNFKEIIPLLTENKIDIGLAGITINETREKIIDFSHQTFESGLKILLSKNRKNIDPTGTIRTFINQGFNRLIKPILIFLLITFVFANALWFAEKNGSFASNYLPGVIQASWVSFSTIIGLLSGGSFTLIYDIHTWMGRFILVLTHIMSLAILGLFIGEITAFITTRKIRLNIERARDLQGKIVATVAGTTSENVLKDLGATVVPTMKIEEAYEKLKRNEVEAVVFDAPVLVYYSLNEGQQWAEVVGELFNKQSYGFALPQGSALREEINKAFLRIKESGQYDLFYKKWFGEDLTMKS